MDDYLPFIIAGLTTGAVYGLAGIGLVLTYKTSGVFNFAHGALATVAAFAFYQLYVVDGLVWPLAAALAVFVVGPVMGLVLEFIARRIAPAGLALQVAATVGLLLVIEAGAELLFDRAVTRTVPVFLSTTTFEVFDTTVRWADVIVFLLAISVTAALALFFRLSRRGAQMRAVVDNPELLSLFGTSPASTRRTAWILGAVLVALSGVLFAPLLPLDPVQLTLLVVAAFGAAALGAFSNLVLTLLGGLAIGVLASLSTRWFTEGLLSGIPVALPFLVLFVALLVFPKGKLVVLATPEARPQASVVVPVRIQATAGLGLLVILAFVPTFAGVRLTSWTLFVAG